MAKEYSKYELSYIYDEPIKYKNLLIYPATVKDYLKFYFFSECLALDKNSINDVKIISMTYLEYLFKLSKWDEFVEYRKSKKNTLDYSEYMLNFFSKENSYILHFYSLLQLVTKNPELEVRYGRNQKNKPVFIVDGNEYTSDDFEEIKQIICEYNMVELPDETIQKEIRDNMKKAQELRRKSSGKMASLEDQIVCVMISSNLSLEQIYNLSIRKFSKILERADAKLHYEIYLSASMSGMVEFKDKSFIKHWMSDLTKQKLDLVPFEKIQDTMSGKPSSAKNVKSGRNRTRK